MVAEQYFLPDDYQVNNEGENVTFDIDEHYVEVSSYWSPQRIKQSLSYQAPIYKFISSRISKHSLVVDIGCGVGSKLAEIIGKKSTNLIGIDQPSAVEIASQKYPEAKFVSADFDDPGSWRALEFSPSVIICSDVVEHLSKPEQLLRLIRYLASENTRIFISTPDRERVRGIANRCSPNKAHVREWSVNEFKKFVQFNGFSVVSVSHHLPYDIRRHGLLNTLRDFSRIIRLPGGSVRYNMLFELRSTNGFVQK